MTGGSAGNDYGSRLRAGRNSSIMEGNNGATAMAKKIAAANIKLKRAYRAASPTDGTRILIDRLWPRGVKKADAAIELWAKELAPSTELRQWFDHDPERWAEFRRRYADEVRQHRAQFDSLGELARQGVITLVFAAHDEAHNNAVVMRDLLLGRSPA